MSIFSKINTPDKFLQNTSWLKNKFLVNFGYLEDGPGKDLDYSTSMMTLQPLIYGDISLKKFFKEISNQYSLGSCVANAVADSLEAQIIQRKGVAPSTLNDLSRLFIYWNARNLNNPPTTDKDNGSKIRFAFDSVARYGVCSENTWKYDESKVLQRPSILAYREAVQNRIYKFYRITSTDENRFLQIKQALSAKNPVVFGITINNSFKYINNDSVVLDDGKGYIGGHAMVCMGWSENKKAFEVRNSWGTDWGIGGYCFIDKNYLINQAHDIWVATF
jgi:C1A family cysteine protease